MASLEESAKKLDFRGLMIGSIVTALGLVVGLFWKDAITETVKQVVPAGEGLFYMYLVAIIVTVVVVIIVFILIKTSEITQKYDDVLKEKLKKEAEERAKSLKEKKEKLVGKKLLAKG